MLDASTGWRWVALHGISTGLCAGTVLVAADVLMAGVVPGLFVHFLLAVLVATGLAATMRATPNIGRSPWLVHFAGLVAGVLLWGHSLYMILPAVGLPSLALASNAALQCVVHAAVFGLGVAAWLEMQLPKDAFATPFERALSRTPAPAFA